jgi:hypothetical protein
MIFKSFAGPIQRRDGRLRSDQKHGRVIEWPPFEP